MATLSMRRIDPFNLLVGYGIWAALAIAILTAASLRPASSAPPTFMT